MKKLFSWQPLPGQEAFLLVLRVTLGALMLMHGMPKIDRFFAPELEFADPIGLGPAVSLILAVFAEVVCSVTLVLGLWTRLSTIPLIITMLVAAFIVHADDPFGKQEFPLLFALAYSAIFFSGPGKYSLDAWLETRKKT